MFINRKVAVVMPVFGLLGEKLAHSLSPLIHSYLGDYEYPLYEIPPGGLDSFMAERSFDGINVTIPYKQAVIPYCETLSEEARLSSSVNTIIKDSNGALHGHNTDWHGFCYMLRRAGVEPRGKKALVLGDGGAARTVRIALQALGAGEIVTISRRGDDNYGNISRHFDAEMIVNTTPVGMYPDNGASPLSLEGFGRLAAVADLIYNPMRTKLLCDAVRAGIPHVNGLAMLVAQAEMAARIFIGEASVSRHELVETILDNIISKTRNIVLIGMPGCGKSTVGRELSKATARPLADIDELIAKAAGKSIPEIFKDDGEEAFRQLETRVLGNETKKNGMVIATGGGVVTRPGNLDLLRQNGLVVYLKRDLAQLATDGRPLSQSGGVWAMAEKRLPLYEAWADCTVTVDERVPATTERVLEAIKTYRGGECREE